MAENIIIHEISLAWYKATSTGGRLDLGTWGSYGIEKLHLTLDAAWQFNCSVVLGEYYDAFGGPTNFAYANVGVKIV